MKNLHIFFLFAFFSILATLARLGVTILSQYPGTYLGGIVWSNFTSCLLMGFLVRSSKTWQYFAVGTDVSSINKKEILLYTALTTGFCGSLSSFSSWILELFLYSSNTFLSLETGHHYKFHNSAYGILQWLSVFITQLAVSAAGFSFGGKVVTSLEDQLKSPKESRTAQIWAAKLSSGLNTFQLSLEVLGACFILISLVLSIVKPHWRSWTLALVFAPFACYLRYFLAQIGNRPRKGFWRVDFLGTFAANFIAVVILSISALLLGAKSGSLLVKKQVDRHVLVAISNGFCGVLSTVSTLISELNSAPLAEAVLYVGLSTICCFCLMVIVLGSFVWTGGFLERIV